MAADEDRKQSKRKRIEVQNDETPQSKKMKSRDKRHDHKSDHKPYKADVRLHVQDGKTMVHRGGKTMRAEEWDALKAQLHEKRGQQTEEKKERRQKAKETALLSRVKLDSTNAREERKKAKKERRRRERESRNIGQSQDYEEKSVLQKSNEEALDQVQINGVATVAEANDAKSIERLLSRLSRAETSQLAGQDISQELNRRLRQADKLISSLNLGPHDALYKARNRFLNHQNDEWTVTRLPSGRFLEHDPLFSLDEKYMFLANSDGVQVYETETSLLARSLHAKGMSCFTLAATNQKQIYLATALGQLYLFDWTTGRCLQSASFEQTTTFVAISALQLPESREDALITIETHSKEKNEDEYSIVIRRTPWNDNEEACQILYNSDRPVRQIKILDQGRVIFAASETKMLIGSLDKLSTTLDMSMIPLTELRSKYRWMELQPNSSIMCMDAQLRTDPLPGDKRGERKDFDLAVGNAKGEILIYQDIVRQLQRLYDEGQGKQAQFRILRWHREAPGAIKWSRDGNYLISGGNETVICLWQLETGKRTDLPHLTAAVKGLTVSPKGIAYGVRLADNSAVVLSTTELTPKTHIAGLQSLAIGISSSSSKDGLSPLATSLYKSTPMVNNPRAPKELLLAVPVDQQNETANKVQPAPFLQSYDLIAGRHMSRQALTRNLVTEVNIDPDWNRIEVPNVTHMKISHDGLWLATVDEWVPPAESLEYLTYDVVEAETEYLKRRETYLKIWSWNEKDSLWTLNTRIDSPHRSADDECVSRVFDLVAHPTKAGFATIGEDSMIRVWQPNARLAEMTWEPNAVIPVENNTASSTDFPEFPTYAAPTIGRLAYSNDGSILSVTQQDDRTHQSSAIVMIDARNSEIKSAETNLATGKVLAMGFLDRYLIVVSNQLCVWDVVKSSLIYSRKFHNRAKTLPYRAETTHLAVNTKSKTFAVAGVGIGDDHGTCVQVYSPTASAPLFELVLRFGVVSALTALVESDGFLVLDSRATLRTIGLSNNPVIAGQSMEVSRAPRTLPLAIEDTEMEKDAIAESSGDLMDVDGLDGDERLLQSDRLAKVFEYGTAGTGLPSVKELFDSVASLFARKA